MNPTQETAFPRAHITGNRSNKKKIKKQKTKQTNKKKNNNSQLTGGGGGLEGQVALRVRVVAVAVVVASGGAAVCGVGVLIRSRPPAITRRVA